MIHPTGTGKYEQMLETCRNMKPIPTAVAHPCEESALSGAIEAAQLGLIVPILVGPRARIEATAKSAGLDISGYEIVNASHSNESAAKAVELLREAKAELLMKGSLHTDEIDGGRGFTRRRIAHGTAHQPRFRNGRSHLPQSADDYRWRDQHSSNA